MGKFIGQELGSNRDYNNCTCLRDWTETYSEGSSSVFFKIFKRVSWWSFRVSTPFSLLCLILLTHFHKNASFRPNML